MSLDALIEAHRAFYRSDSERRLATWLRQEIHDIFIGNVGRPAVGGTNGVMTSPAASANRASEKRLEPAEVAKRLNRKIKTIANWRSKGEGPRWIKIRGSVYYLESELEAWEQAQIGNDERLKA